jgi:hypothetical protein
MRPGYCSYCQRWLGASHEQAVSVQSMSLDGGERWQAWVSETLGDLLASAAAACSPLTALELSERLSAVNERATDGNIEALGRVAGCTQHQIYLWVKRGTRPHLDMLLRVCFALNLSLVDVLAQGARKLCTVVPKTMRPVNASRRRLYRSPERARLQLALEGALASEEYPQHRWRKSLDAWGIPYPSFSHVMRQPVARSQYVSRPIVIRKRRNGSISWTGCLGTSPFSFSPRAAL